MLSKNTENSAQKTFKNALSHETTIGKENKAKKTSFKKCFKDSLFVG